MTIFLAAETYFDPKSGYTLKKMSTEQYVRSPLFEMIGIGVAVNDGEPEWMEASEFAAEAKHIPWERCAVGAHNTEFDALILSHHYNVHPGLLIDTLAMGRLLHGTQMSLRLENLAKHYAVGEKGHEIDKAEGKHRADFSQDEWLRYGEYCKQDVRLCRAIYMKMIDEGFPDSELWVVDLITRMFTEPQFILDEPLLKAYLIEERQRKAALMRKVAGVGPEVPDAQIDPLVRPHLMSNPKFAEALMDSGVVPPRKVSPTTGKETWAFAKSDPGMQALLESEDEEVRLLVEARVGVKSTINESRTERFLKLGAGGRLMPIQINYAAARTLRCGGAGGTNFLNLERTNKKNTKKGALRKSLLAPPGYMVVAVDSGQIEARVNAWFSGHAELLEAFARDEDVYSAFASKVYGRPIDRKTVKEDEIPGQVGKISVLGLGYSLGPANFAAVMLQGALGGPKIQFGEAEAALMGVDVLKFCASAYKLARVRDMPSRLPLEERIIHCAVCEFIVYQWRNANRPIVEMWKTMDAVIGGMLEENVSYTFGPGGVLSTVRHGIRLPNGTVVRYPGLKRSEEEDGKPRGFSYLGGGGGKQWQRCYGGLCLENCIQALSRIIVSDQMLALYAKYRYRPALWPYDELVYVVPEADALQVKMRCLEEMKKAPSWAPGLPLAADAGIGASYGAAK